MCAFIKKRVGGWEEEAEGALKQTTTIKPSIHPNFLVHMGKREEEVGETNAVHH